MAFNGSVFRAIPVFEGAAFAGPASFERTSFKFESKFARARFLGQADFSKATFDRHADFSTARFDGPAHFTESRFIRGVDFGGAVFAQLAYFFLSQFEENASFQGAHFHQNGDFSYTSFAGAVSFTDVSFDDHADFGSATLGGYCDFSKTTFSKVAKFIRARFGEVRFNHARMAHHISFTAATFSNFAVFSECLFGPSADFSAYFLGSARLECRLSQFDGTLSFADAQFDPSTRVLLHRINEKHSSPLRIYFGSCLLDGFRFEDVNWLRRRSRLVIGDELAFRNGGQGVTPEVVADAYRRLVTVFDKARQHDLAEECVIGEMEMRRLDARHLFLGGFAWARSLYSRSSLARITAQFFSLLNWYRMLSNYGSSYRRAGLCVLALLLGFSLLFPIFGLKPSERSNLKPHCPGTLAGSPDAARISWSCATAHTNANAELWGTFKAGMWASIETATFQRDKLFEPTDNYGRVLVVLESIVIPGQVALLLLALRRRFRR